MLNNMVAHLAVIGAGHHDASNEYTSIEDTVAATKMARERGLGGVMTWDINRDCRWAWVASVPDIMILHVRGRMGNTEGEDNLYQTGQGDGLYLDTISATLNSDSDNCRQP